MTDTHENEPRLQSPDALDVDTLRACVDAALRLLGEDAEAKYGPALERHWARPDWEEVVAREPGKPMISRRDPAFWLREMQRSGSPARSSPSLQHPHSAFVPRLREANRARNEHCHFAVIDVDLTLDRLVVLKRAADQLRLPCSSDIRGVITAIHRLRDGSAPRPPTLAEAERLALENRELTIRRDESERNLQRALEDRDRALDDIATLRVQIEDATSATNESERLRQELKSARAQAERLQQDADIAAAHQREVEHARLQLEAEQLLPTQYPIVVQEVLGHMHAFSIAAMSAHVETDELFTDAAGEPFGLVGELIDLADLLDDLGAPRQYADNLPRITAGARERMVEHSRAVSALTEADAWRSALDSLDLDSRAVVSRLSTLFQKQVALLRLADVVAGALRDQPTRVATGVLREVQDGDPIAPGESWPFPAGEDTWVLSARDRELRRPGSRRSVRLGDLIGAQLETELVDAFLLLRPEGGRVFIDADGDMSTYVGQELIYLGKLPRT